MALQTLKNLPDQQASSLAYFDVYWLLSVLALGLVALVFFIKLSAAENGAHVAAE
jgi:DHA2 family multidrug resistance protein